MSIALVQARAADGNASSVPLAYSSNVTAGSLLVAVTTGSTGGTFTVTDNKSNTWTGVDAQKSASNNISIGCRLWYAMNAAAGATTVTFGGAGSSYALVIAEFSAVATTSALDGTLHSIIAPPNGTASAPTGAAFTPSANDLAIGGYGDTGPSAETLAAASGWTMAASASDAVGLSAALIYRVLTSSTSVTAGISGSADTLPDEVIGWAAFLPAAGGATDPFPAGYGHTYRAMGNYLSRL